MNNRHRRVERLRRQQVISSCKQYDVTPEMVEKLYKDVSEIVSNIVIGAGSAFINIGKAFMDAGERWRSTVVPLTDSIT